MVGENISRSQCSGEKSNKDVLACMPGDVGRDGDAEGSVALGLEGCLMGESAEDISLDS